MVQATRYLYVVKDDEILSRELTIQATRTPVRAIVETGCLLKTTGQLHSKGRTSTEFTLNRNRTVHLADDQIGDG